MRHKLEECRKEDNPEAFAPDDPLRPEQPRKADWPAIVRLAQETLRNTSKDLLVAARLTEALAKVHGFAGVRDGLHLLRELVEQAWDRVLPSTEDSDPEVRAGPFYWLDDADKGARFPTTVRMVPMIFGNGAEFSWLNWKESTKEKGAIPREEYEQAEMAAPFERCEAVADSANQSMSELDGLVQALTEKMGAHAPALAALREAVEVCQSLINEIVRKKRPVLAADTHSNEEQPNAPRTSAGRAPQHGRRCIVSSRRPPPCCGSWSRIAPSRT